MLKKALDLIWLAYDNEVGPDGTPYVFDAVLTALKMNNDVDKTVALLMNVLEKSAVKVEDLEEQHFPQEVIDAIIALTRGEDESFGAYLDRIGKNEYASRVKIAEFKNKIEELKDELPNEKNSIKIEKYGYAIEFLENCDNGDASEEDEWI